MFFAGNYAFQPAQLPEEREALVISTNGRNLPTIGKISRSDRDKDFSHPFDMTQREGRFPITITVESERPYEPEQRETLDERLTLPALV